MSNDNTKDIQAINEALLIELGFVGPYPHGEYRLFDETCATKSGDCCIMTVDQPRSPGNSSKRWHCSWNILRKLWHSTEKRMPLKSPEDLEKAIALSRAWNPMP